MNMISIKRIAAVAVLTFAAPVWCAGCASSHTHVRTYERTEDPDPYERERSSTDATMVSPGEMQGEGEMVSPG
ncbi:MAG: hypothetical protein IIB61_03040 [Planctomycetes bacterium]|nr:hypothetical protein [Planctomycetota bacterium]